VIRKRGRVDLCVAGSNVPILAVLPSLACLPPLLPNPSGRRLIHLRLSLAYSYPSSFLPSAPPPHGTADADLDFLLDDLAAPMREAPAPVVVSGAGTCFADNVSPTVLLLVLLGCVLFYFCWVFC
jgi:hypothetical protein